MQELHILSGLPASGKTTYAEKLVEQYPSLIHLSRDKIRAEIRKELKSEEYFPTSQSEEWANWIKIINENIILNSSVIIDQTTLGSGSLKKLLESIIVPEKSIIFVHLFLVSLAECQFRNGFRTGFEYVPPNVIQKMHAAAFKFLSPKDVWQILAQVDKSPISVAIHTHQ